MHRLLGELRRAAQRVRDKGTPFALEHARRLKNPKLAQMADDCLRHVILARRCTDPPNVECLAVAVPSARAAHVLAEGGVTVTSEAVMGRVCLSLVRVGRRAVAIAAVLAIDAAAACKVEANASARVGVVCSREPSVSLETHTGGGASSALEAILSSIPAVPNVVLANVLRLLQLSLLLDLDARWPVRNSRQCLACNELWVAIYGSVDTVLLHARARLR